MSRKTNLKRVISSVLAVLICVPVLTSGIVFADTDTNINASIEQQTSSQSENASESNLFVRQKTYSEYYDEIADVGRPGAEADFVYVGSDADAEVTVGTYEGVDNAVIWSNQVGTLDFNVDVPESGAYNIEIKYYPITGGNTTTEVSVLLDGMSPYETATRVELPRVWASAYPITTDSKDNEIRPPQVEKSPGLHHR